MQYHSHFWPFTFCSSSLTHSQRQNPCTFHVPRATHFNCFEKSSLVSSSSQLSSHKCVFCSPGTSASSCGQSNHSEFCQRVTYASRSNSCCCLPSTGKSSNSSSSSSAAAGFCCSLSVVDEVSSEVTALVVEAGASAAADMVI